VSKPSCGKEHPPTQLVTPIYVNVVRILHIGVSYVFWMFLPFVFSVTVALVA